MRSRVKYLLILVLTLGQVAAQAEDRLIVRVKAGLGALQKVCRIAGCNVVRGLDDPDSQLFLVTTASRGVTTLLERILPNGLAIIEADTPISLISKPASVPAIPAGLLDRRPTKLDGDTVWNGYAQQPAAGIVRAEEARGKFSTEGRGIVAVIDTGVDPHHPALHRVLVPGYDFTRNQPGMGSELPDLNSSMAAVVDRGAAPARVNQSTVAVVDQSTVAVVDDGRHAAFGHGTMVAGIVHLVAPRTGLMSLKAFRSDGTGYTSDIIRAVYYAARNNAKVINMSFSMADSSRELERAIRFAIDRGIICVASAGNNGNSTVVYPAGFKQMMAVASTNLHDRRSTFSSFGSRYGWVAAPGEGIITTYPLGSYAAGWGTSFSTPFVSGTAALLLELEPNLDQTAAAKWVANAKPAGGELGNGRLDIVQAMDAAKSQR